MSTLAQELDEHLQRLDPATAGHVERLVREVLALTKPIAQPATVTHGEEEGLHQLARLAEPLGTLTNAEIDRAVYGH